MASVGRSRVLVRTHKPGQVKLGDRYKFGLLSFKEIVALSENLMIRF